MTKTTAEVLLQALNGKFSDEKSAAYLLLFNYLLVAD